MAIPSVMADLSTTAATNSPAGSESPSNGDDFLRAIQAIVRTTNAKGADIASATTTDIGAATGEFVDVTGTTTITGLGTIAAGIVRTVRFTGALTLTHNATSLILPSSANITTANGDVAQFRSLGSGNWKCTNYIRQNGNAFGVVDGAITRAKLANSVYGTGLKGAALASAATTNIFTAADGDLVHITGTTAITSFGTATAAGDYRKLVIDSAGVVLTHGANLVCPEGVDIVSSAGDILVIVADTTTQHRVESYVRGGSRHAMGTFTRNMAAASTTQVITGVGFRPKKVRFIMANAAIANAGFSVGEDNGTTAFCVYDSNGTTANTNTLSTSVSIRSQSAAGNFQTGVISAFSNDGFTVSWVLGGAGSPFTATIAYVAEM